MLACLTDECHFLAFFAPQWGNLSRVNQAAFIVLLVALVLVDQAAPVSPVFPPARRTVWLGTELILCFLVVYAHGV
jgi:hypothetical protein